MSLFVDEKNPKTGRMETKPVDFTSPIGMYRDLKDVHGFNKLDDKVQEYLTFLFRNYSTSTSGFIKAEELARIFNCTTRQIRDWNYKIDKYTDLVVWSSAKYGGIKLAANDEEMTKATEEALAQAKGALRHAFAKAKNHDLHYTHNLIGFYEKQYQGKPQGQMFMTFTQDDSGDVKVVNHFAKQSDGKYKKSHDERIKEFQKIRRPFMEYMELAKEKPYGMSDEYYKLRLKQLEIEIKDYMSDWK